jgi:hypothetical protein
MQTEAVGNRSKPTPRFRHRKEQESKRARANTLNVGRIKKLASIGMPFESIAYSIGVSPSWLGEQKQKNFEIEEAILAGQYEFEEGLRTTQARLALSGHPGMLIWLGKQFLGQSDKQESKQETTVNVVLQNAMKELRELDADTLQQMKLLLEQKKTPPVIDGVSSEVSES